MPGDALAAAVRQCPFLALVSARQGEPYARSLAANPHAPASAGPLLLEEEGMSSLASTLRLFHGPGGVVPLRRFEACAAEAPTKLVAGCPFRAAAEAYSAAATTPRVAAAGSSVPSSSGHAVSGPAPTAAAACGVSAARPPPVRLPFASMSISGFGFVPDPGQFFSRPQRPKQQRAKQQRKPADGGNSRTSSGDGGGAGGGRPGATSGSTPGASSGGGGGGSGSDRLRPAGGPGGGHKHGWSRVLGGLIPLAANGHITCPAPIVKMRAAVAALKPVRELRPQALPIRALALAGTAVAANLPCGAWRQHTKKFSPQWFLAVHATIPFVAMLRKAVLMPPWAVLLTVAGAIAGQNVGARMERRRISQPLGPGSPSLALPAGDCVMPGLQAGCRQALQAARGAASWTLAPVVVP